MSVAFEEHDYIGLSEAPPLESSDENMNKKEEDVEKEKPSPESDRAESGLELRLGLPGSTPPERDPAKGSVAGAKRGFSDAIDFTGKWGFSGRPVKGFDGKPGSAAPAGKDGVPAPASPKPGLEKKPQVPSPAAKAQVVGWPPIRSFRKNSMSFLAPKSTEDSESKLGSGCLYVKVSMEGAPYLRKVDLKTYKSYIELSSALEKMFSCFTIGQLDENGLTDLLHGSEYVLTFEDKDGDWMLVGDVPWEMFTESCKKLRIMKSSDAIGLAPRAMDKCKTRS
ncbi:hypothetical protein CRG98_011316 [Punica granatum]|uniref:Auxin-responsive protein n=1 Tax=Punica granatum TaxID=22663 RepID=A0A2I0KKH2_PUNGR|nr:hypothetical protein CRG98_011316 [Punica granatum]